MIGETPIVPVFNPKGIVSFSQELPSLRGYLGACVDLIFNPNEVVSSATIPQPATISLGLLSWLSLTQGSSFLATLDCVIESRWDTCIGLRTTEANS